MLPLSSWYRCYILKGGEIFLRAVGTHVECQNPKYNFCITFATTYNPHNFVDRDFILQRFLFSSCWEYRRLWLSKLQTSRDIMKYPEFLYLKQFPISMLLVLRYSRTTYFSGPSNKPVKTYWMFRHFKWFVSIHTCLCDIYYIIYPFGPGTGHLNISTSFM
jgi:hypothetical protein